MSGCLLHQVDNDKAKQLLISFYAKQFPPGEAARKQAKLNQHLKIIEKDQFDAVLYSLKTVVKKVEDSEIFIDLTSKIRPQFSDQDTFRQQKCHQCNGKKIMKCTSCRNLYSINCNYCESDTLQTCHHCNNSTFTFNDKCKTCHNKRFVVCDLCKGCGEINCYKGKITKTEPIEDFVINCKDNSIPLMVICKGKGTVIVDQTKKKLEAINHYPDDAIHKNCKDLLERHKMRMKQSPSWELVNQNQKLVAIPILSYTAQCKEKKIKFMIIGDNLDVYIPKIAAKNPCSIS